MENFINIGNVKFLKNDVLSSSVKYQNNQKINCVFLKNGTSIEFKDQKADAKASVQTGSYMDECTFGQNNGTGFTNIDGLKILGSNKDDYYHLWKCTNYDVDTSRGGKDEIRIIGNTPHMKGMINADYDDKISSQNLDRNATMSMNEGWFVKWGDEEEQEVDPQVKPFHFRSEKTIEGKWQTEKFYNDQGQLKQVTYSYDMNGDGKFDNSEFNTIDKFDYGWGSNDKVTVMRYQDVDMNGDCDVTTKYTYKNGKWEQGKPENVDKSKLTTEYQKHNNKMTSIQQNLFMALGSLLKNDNNGITTFE